MDSDRTNSSEGLDPIHIARHDWEASDSVVVTVARALADCDAVEPDELPPLYESIDTDALDALFRRSGHTDRDRDAFVRFSIPDSTYLVTVRADGCVCIAERPDSVSS